MLLTSKFQDVVNLAEGIFHRVVAIDSKIVVAMEIIGTNRFGLCLIYLETFFDGDVVVIGATASFATIEESFDDFVFFYEEVEKNGLHMATVEQQFECFCLSHGTRKAIEDDSFAVGR